MDWQALLAELGAWTALETTAVALALIYLILAARERLACWAFAFASSAIFLYLFMERQVYQQGLLQVFYVAMAVYGYWHWRHGGRADHAAPIRSWPAHRHLLAGAAVLALTLVTGWAEDRYTDAAMPYLDAFTTWGAVITTWMVTRKILENWLYWLVVDGASAYLCFRAGLPATGLLFVLYLGIVIAGYFSWRRLMRAQPA